MAKSGAAVSAGILGDATRFADLRQRLLFLIGALVVYRIGTFIPVPGVDPVAMQQLFPDQSGTILQMFTMFSGGALERMSIFALNIMPYIQASTIMQMATHVGPALQQLFQDQSGTILQMFNMCSGGALERMAIFALNIMPYISASIIMQMATHVVPTLQQLRKEGESGRRKITQYTRYGTVLLSSFQAIAAATALQTNQVVINPGTGFVVTAAITL